MLPPDGPTPKAPNHGAAAEMEKLEVEEVLGVIPEVHSGRSGSSSAAGEGSGISLWGFVFESFCKFFKHVFLQVQQKMSVVYGLGF